MGRADSAINFVRRGPMRLVVRTDTFLPLKYGEIAAIQRPTLWCN